MREFKYKRTVFKVDVYGEAYEVKRLTGGELLEYQASMDGLDENEVGFERKINEQTEIMFEKQGLPREVYKSMELDHTNELLKAVCGNEQGK